MENKRSYTISIRLHSLSVKRCDDVLKSIYRDDEKSKLSSTILSKNIGKGKAYALLEQRSVPKWRDEFEHFSAGKIKIMENVYSKALVVIELKDSLKQTRFLSISFGRGNSLLDEATIVGDFGKIIAAKKIAKNMIRSVGTMEISDAIIQSNKQAVGSNSPSVDDFLKVPSEFPSSIAGISRNGSVETKLEGSGELLKITRTMNQSEIVGDLKYYLKEYTEKGTVADWISRLSKVSASQVKKELGNALANQIINTKTDFGIAWPTYTPTTLLSIVDLSKKMPENIIEPLDQLKWYINKQKPSAETLLNKIKSSHVRTEDEFGQIESRTLFKCMVVEVYQKKKRYLLFNGDWFEASKEFYEELKKSVDSVPAANLHLPRAKPNEYETDYNYRATKSLKGAVELHLTGYTNAAVARGSIEPADIVTPDRKFIYVKYGTSSANLSHLFMQAYVAAQLLSQDVDKNFRTEISKSTGFSNDFLNESVQNNQIEIIFAIIKKNRSLPFFSMISFAEAIRSLKVMNFKPEIEWIDTEKS
ncbi:TIGR04141 family sporadically distributed protein [Pediococcus inopinatus]|uniref:DUF6119 family protein n=1 Tax=Pediococcus inopinatus TaxID=114090 RepID=UPI002B25C791|nr:DUF6119 family protein [Pediococcus inopinatus]WPC18770.1 TIGR04141 family sporadically distributed protein [Pediococcus inopinatus]